MGVEYFATQCGASDADEIARWCVAANNPTCCAICPQTFASIGLRVSTLFGVLCSAAVISFDAQEAPYQSTTTLITAFGWLVTIMSSLAVESMRVSRFHANYALFMSIGYVSPLASVSVTSLFFLEGGSHPKEGQAPAPRRALPRKSSRSASSSHSASTSRSSPSSTTFQAPSHILEGFDGPVRTLTSGTQQTGLSGRTLRTENEDARTRSSSRHGRRERGNAWQLPALSTIPSGEVPSRHASSASSFELLPPAALSPLSPCDHDSRSRTPKHDPGTSWLSDASDSSEERQKEHASTPSSTRRTLLHHSDESRGSSRPHSSTRSHQRRESSTHSHKRRNASERPSAGLDADELRLKFASEKRRKRESATPLTPTVRKARRAAHLTAFMALIMLYTAVLLLLHFSYEYLQGECEDPDGTDMLFYGTILYIALAFVVWSIFLANFYRDKLHHTLALIFHLAEHRAWKWRSTFVFTVALVVLVPWQVILWLAYLRATQGALLATDEGKATFTAVLSALLAVRSAADIAKLTYRRVMKLKKEHKQQRAALRLSAINEKHAGASETGRNSAHHQEKRQVRRRRAHEAGATPEMLATDF